MYEALAQAIEEVELPHDRESLVALVALADRLSARVSEAVAAYDAADSWDADGATSMGAWLRHECGRSLSGAAREVRVAQRLRPLPVTRAAWRSGGLSTAQVEVVAGLVRPHLLAAFAAAEGELVPLLEPLSVDETTVAVRAWVERAEALEEGPEPAAVARRLHVGTSLDGTAVLDGVLDADGAAVVTEALRLARRPDDEDERRTRAARDADALVDALGWFLAHHGRVDRPGRQRARVEVVVDLDDVHASHLQHVGVSTVAELEAYLAGQPRTTAVKRALLRAGLERLTRPGASHARTVAGWPVSLALAAALACDGSLRRVLTSGSEILDYGRPARAAVVPQAIRDAVTLRDRGCRYPGCDRGIDWCEVHHLVPRSHGGGHAVTNCALVCARHHHVLHRPGWRAVLATDGTLRVTDPGGRTRATRPPGPHPRAPDPFDHAA